MASDILKIEIRLFVEIGKCEITHSKCIILLIVPTTLGVTNEGESTELKSPTTDKSFVVPKIPSLSGQGPDVSRWNKV